MSIDTNIFSQMILNLTIQKKENTLWATWVIPQVKAILPLKYQANVINHKVANTTDKIYTIIFLPAEEHVEKIKSNPLWNKRESP